MSDKFWGKMSGLGIAKRAIDVITQTNPDKQNGMAEDLKFFFFNRVSMCSYNNIYSEFLASILLQNTLRLSDFRGVPIICILFSDFARFIIEGTRIISMFLLIIFFFNGNKNN